MIPCVHINSDDGISLRKIADSGQCFRMNEIQHGRYELVAFGRFLEVSQDENGINLFCSDDEYCNIWRQYFDLDQNYRSIIQSAKEQYCSDGFLMDAIQDGDGIRILRQDFYEMLISFIISQRKSIPSIKRCVEAICLKYGNPIHAKLSTGESVTRYSFPEPHVLARLEPEDLKDCGVGYRAPYIIAASSWYLENHDTYRLEYSGYQTAVNILRSEIFGVGIKIANCVCLFGLHHLEACPIDVWMQRIISEDYGSDIPRWMDDQYAGILQQYCFYYKRIT